LPPSRLLILADPKMIPALAAGLREGGRFEVTALSLADVAAAQSATERVDAVSVFYGAPGASIAATLQAVAPKLRERGARVVAVLQRDQLAQRDECFRAGASDVLYMPLPKEQFVSRLAASVSLSFAAEGGAPAAVAVAARAGASRLDRATVCAIGVEAPAALPLKPGDTVRLSWGTFQSWGLVVRGGPSAQIRFAGLSAEEQGKIQQWVKSGAQLAGTPGTTAPQAAAIVPPPPPPAPQAAPLVPPPAPAAAAAERPPAPAAAPQPITGRIAPTAGPPPGFADRKSVRAQTQTQPRPAPRPAAATPPTGTPASPKAPATPDRAKAAAPSSRRPANGAEGLEALFDGEVAPQPAPAVEKKKPPEGPPWPAPIDAAVCKEAALQLLTDDTVGSGVPANVAASARKITGMLSPGERASMDRHGPDSHFVDTLAARIALDAAAAEGNKLSAGGGAPTVVAETLAALTKIADEAAARLTKEANAAIAKGEVETLQLVTAASAALSRDLLNVKELADRLRGVSVAPRLGAGALDPDMVLPGQQPRPRPAAPQGPAPIKAELRDFRGLEQKPGRSKGVIAFLLLSGAVAAGAYAYFNMPGHARIPVEATGAQSIAISGKSAMVTVTPQWTAAMDANLPKLVQALRARKVEKAMLTLGNGSAVGMLDVATGKMIGTVARSAAK